MRCVCMCVHAWGVCVCVYCMYVRCVIYSMYMVTHHPGKCKTAPKQSVETHSAWYLIPPADQGGIDWDVFPEDVRHVRAQADGFRGFVVEFYNVVSDVVVQDGYQSVLNLRTVLQQIGSRHPRIRRYVCMFYVLCVCACDVCVCFMCYACVNVMCVYVLCAMRV